MAWFDTSTTLQEFPKQFEALMNSHGWSTYAKFRAVINVGNKVDKRYAEARLFRSVGSDSQIRFFGMAHAYGKSAVDAQDFISQNSPLGEVGVGDGILKAFRVKVYPIVPGSLYLYDDGALVNPSLYTVDSDLGWVTYKLTSNAPLDASVLTSSYQPDIAAPDPIRRMMFFTFEDVRGEKVVAVGDPMSILPDGDGVNKIFQIPTTATISPATLSILVNQIIVNPVDYVFDPITNKIEFVAAYAAPVMGSELHAGFTLTLGGGSGTIDFGDMLVETAFDPANITEVMGAVYSSLQFLFPSLPTVMSITPLANFNRGWQRDSTVYYWGNVNKDRLVGFVRPDASAGPENTYYAPLYIGKLSTIGKYPRKNNIVISGCRTADEQLWAVDKKIGPNYVDYGPNTTNGNSGIQLQQSIGGTYYQKHYMSFFTHDKRMDAGEARFNPSVYSEKYHTSKIGIVHPNDGLVGYLDDCYAVHPKQIFQTDELEMDETAIEEEIGIGTGSRKSFHTLHCPKLVNQVGTTLIVQSKVKGVSGCTLIPASDFVFDPDTKELKFTVAPAQGLILMASYQYKQIYRYTLADTPSTPFQLASISPYAPIGLGILKENII